MSSEELFTELKSLAAELSLPVRFEQGDFEGGICVVNDARVLIVNKRATMQKKIATLAASLAQCDLDSIFVKPAVREAIDDELAKLRAEARNAALAPAAPAPTESAPASS